MHALQARRGTANPLHVQFYVTSYAMESVCVQLCHNDTRMSFPLQRVSAHDDGSGVQNVDGDESGQCLRPVYTPVIRRQAECRFVHASAYGAACVGLPTIAAAAASVVCCVIYIVCRHFSLSSTWQSWLFMCIYCPPYTLSYTYPTEAYIAVFDSFD